MMVNWWSNCLFYIQIYMNSFCRSLADTFCYQWNYCRPAMRLNNDFLIDELTYCQRDIILRIVMEFLHTILPVSPNRFQVLMLISHNISNPSPVARVNPFPLRFLSFPVITHDSEWKVVKQIFFFENWPFQYKRKTFTFFRCCASLLRPSIRSIQFDHRHG